MLAVTALLTVQLSCTYRLNRELRRYLSALPKRMEATAGLFSRKSAKS
jgi:hypothetical protein